MALCLKLLLSTEEYLSFILLSKFVFLMKLFLEENNVIDLLPTTTFLKTYVNKFDYKNKIFSLYVLNIEVSKFLMQLLLPYSCIFLST